MIAFKTGVTQITLSDLIVRWNSSSYGQGRQQCEAVLVAVGFGVEEGVSYWKDDGLELAPIGDGAFQVSGIGDGGLVDTFRIRLGSSNPRGRFFAWLSNEFLGGVPADVRDNVRAVEREVLAANNDERDTAYRLEARYGEIVSSLRAHNVAVIESLVGRRRFDTTVRLVGRLPAPYSAKASALNRFLLALLQDVDRDRLQYVEGEVDRTTGTISDSHGNSIPLGGRTHVMRLGPRAALALSFRDIAGHLRNSARLVGLEAPRRPIWQHSDFGAIDQVIADPGITP